jgi:hypothetical protein
VVSDSPFVLFWYWWHWFPLLRLYRRKITVFSASLAAFTIDSSEPEKEGTDLLLSFHDNDHYNSVRKKNSPPKPVSSRKGNKKKTEVVSEAAASNEPCCSLEPGKTQMSSEAEPAKVARSISKEDDTTTSSITSNMSALSLEDDEKAKGEDAQVKTAAQLKKSSPCPCGSGIKYRKCCRTKEKQMNKAHDRSKSRGACSRASIDDDSNSPHEDIEVTLGGFRVLKI